MPGALVYIFPWSCIMFSCWPELILCNYITGVNLRAISFVGGGGGGGGVPYCLMNAA